MIRPLFKKYYYKVITKDDTQKLVLYERYNVRDFINNFEEITKQFYKKTDKHSKGKNGQTDLQYSISSKTYANGKNARSCLCLACSFDIETTKVNDHLTFMYGWQFGIEDIVVWGETFEEVIELFDFLKLKLQFKKSQRLLCFIANLSYEWQFIRKYLNVTKAFLKEKREPIEIEHNDFIILKECLSWGGSLEKLAHDYTDIVKLKGDLDYSIYRESYYDFTQDEEWQYIDFDVLTLTHFARWYFNEFSRGSRMIKPITIQSSIRNTFYERGKDSQELQKVQRSFLETAEQYKILVNYVYRGGFVHANQYYIGEHITEETHPKLWSFDFTSSYPSVMCCERYPYKFSKCLDKTKYNFNYLLKSNLDDYAYIGHFIFYDVKAKTSQTIESTSKALNKITEKDPKNKIDNGRIQETPFLDVWLTEQDMLSYSEFYTFSKSVCLELWQSKKDYLPKYIIDELIERYFAKDYNKKHGLNYAIEKAILNSLYGVCVAKLPVGEIKVFNGDCFSTIDRDEEETDEEYKERIEQMYIDTYNDDISNEKKTILPQFGVWISSYARRNLLATVSRLEATGNPVVYCDTDSVKFLDYNNGRQIIEEYNKKQTEKIKAFCKRTGADFNIFYDLGSFDCEYKNGIKAFKTLGAKRYLHVYEDKKSLHYTCTVAGLPKKDYISRYKPENDKDYKTYLHAFKDGLMIEKTSKLTSTYTDELQSVVLRDGSTRFVPSCVTLNDCSFKLGLNGVWVLYLLGLQGSKFENRMN